MGLLAQMMGNDSRYALEKRKLSLERASGLGGFIQELPWVPRWSFLRLSMNTRITLVVDFLLIVGLHPEEEAVRAEAPRRAAPLPAAPATLRNFLRVSSLCTAAHSS